MTKVSNHGPIFVALCIVLLHIGPEGKIQTRKVRDEEGSDHCGLYACCDCSSVLGSLQIQTSCLKGAQVPCLQVRVQGEEREEGRQANQGQQAGSSTQAQASRVREERY